MEILSLWKNKTGFLLNSDCLSTTVRRHHLDSNETHGEKARRETRKNIATYFERIL